MRRLVQQPNGFYALWDWSAIDFVRMNVRRDDARRLVGAAELERADDDRDLDSGDGRRGGYTRWRQCMNMIRSQHGEARATERDRTDVTRER